MTDASRASTAQPAEPVSCERWAIITPNAAPAPPQVSVQEQLSYARTRLGRTLNDRWHLDSLLGVGGMASVYAATHRNGNRVAIKILHPELSVYEELKERFLEEAYAANNVAHPGVVAVHDDGTSEDGAVYLVMELLEGETLQARWQHTPFGLSPRDILEIADQILEVLEVAHRKGIVHRDIKPENVFLTRDDRVKLLDFGIAHNEHTHRAHRTQAGSAMGTPAFMPPEQARGHADQIDGRTDLWALGATLFWLASGRFVRSEGTTNEELLQAMTRPAPALREVAPHAPRALARLIDTALAFEKSSRFADASAMRVAVWQTFAALEAGADPELPPLDLSVQLAAVLLPENDSAGPESFLEPPTTYRPVTSSTPSPSSPRVSSTKRSRKRLAVVLALGIGTVPAMTFVALARTSETTAWTRDPASLSLGVRAALGAAPLQISNTVAENEATPELTSVPSVAASAPLVGQPKNGPDTPRMNDGRPRALGAKSRIQAMPSAPRYPQSSAAQRATSKTAHDLGAGAQAPSSPSRSESPHGVGSRAVQSKRDPLSRRK